MAEGDDGDFYCLEDCSGRYSPDQQMQVVAEAFYRHEADCVVAEVNVAGDFIRSLLNTVDPNIPLRAVTGMRGKVSRAQGASACSCRAASTWSGTTSRSWKTSCPR